MTENSETDRSELPTAYKLKRSRDQGVVARGMDLGILSSLSAFLICAWIWGEAWLAQIAAGIRAAMITGPQLANSEAHLLQLAGLAASGTLRPVIMVLAAVFACVLVFELAQTGFVFATAALKIDFNRLNPAQGLKRLFSVRLLIETAKGVAKMLVYVGLTIWLIWALPRTRFGPIQDARSLADSLYAATLHLLVLLAAAAAAFMILDQLVARRDFLKRMRMSRREVRRESRDREGDPRLKQRRRQLHGDFTKVSQSVRDIRGADVLITNPTHYAVALRYDPQKMAAPMVVASGVNHVALRLKRLAFIYGVTVVENPPLARALARLPLRAETPGSLFRPIADIYLRLRELKAGPSGETDRVP